MNQGVKVYVVVTAYNESKYLGRFLEKLKLKTENFVVVDDGSSDQTSKIAALYTKNVLIHPVNLGKGAAMKTGADYAFAHLDATHIIFMDGDDQHSPEDLDVFYQLINNSKSANLIFGVRNFSDKKMPISRILGNRFASFLVKLLFGHFIPDIPSGFKAMSKSIYEKLRWQSSDYGIELEIACKTAKLEIPFQTVSIKTIYHDLDRGMSLTDPLKMVYKIFMWKVNL